MPDPINYTGLQIQVDPAQALMSGVKAGFGIQQIQQAQQQQEMQQQALQQQRADLSALLSHPNPSPQDYAAYTMKYPAQAAATKQAFGLLDEARQQQQVGDASRIYGALQGGRPDLASAILDTRIQATKNGGNPGDYQSAQVLKQLIDTAPQQATKFAGLYLASVMGPDKFSAAFPAISKEAREDQLQPYTVAKAQGEAAKSQAEGAIAPDMQAADLAKKQADISNVLEETKTKVANRGLDQGKFELEYAEKMRKLQNPDLNPGMQKLQADSVASSLTSLQSADRANDLADRFIAVGPSAGLKAKGAELWKTVTGNQDDVTNLRKEWLAMRGQASLSMLPPGPASDKDIENVKAGFPSDNASPESIAAWLKSFANVQKAVGLREQAKADWLNSTGGLGNAARDIEVGGVRVPKGTSFVDFMKSGQYGKINDTPSAASQSTQQIPAYMRYATQQ